MRHALQRRRAGRDKPDIPACHMISLFPTKLKGLSCRVLKLRLSGEVFWHCVGKCVGSLQHLQGVDTYVWWQSG